jgi:hypothetical protein
LTDLALGSIFSACSTSSFGTPGMSEGHQAKISQCSWRNSMSALSYAGVQVYRYGGGFVRVHRVDLDFLRVLGCVESLIWQGSSNVG